MVYAQVSNSQVVNTVVVDETTPMDLLSRGFDALLRIDNLDVIPGIGWGYDGASFIAPPPQVDETDETQE